MKVYIRKGDTLWYYSQLFSVPLLLLSESNRAIIPDALDIGETVHIPGYHREKYTIQPGDSLWSISQKVRVPIDALLLMNQEKDLLSLKLGEGIYIPSKIVRRVVNGKKKYDSTALLEDLKSLQEMYPFIKCSSIGQSVLGQPLHHVTLGKGEKKVHWNGSCHANEWITTAVIMTLLNDFLLALTNNGILRGVPVIPLFDQVTLSIVPMVNPDGVDLVLNGPPEATTYRDIVEGINQGRSDYLGWKANIRGVDLNKHFPAGWEYEKARKEEKVPSPRDFPGDTPLTEPEAKAMAELTKSENFDRVIAVHTQGEEFYWGYEGNEPTESATIALEFERVSSYKSVRYVDSHAGYKDWFIQEFKKPGFTLELGKGINPLPLSQFTTIYQKTLGIFLASLYM